MHSTCESEEEYRISNALLAAYLHSPSFVSTATEPVAERIRLFIRDNVEPLETILCFIAVATSATTTHTPTLHMREPTMD